MDARELLSSAATFVADTSAWWRVVALPQDLAELLQTAILDDRMLITPIVRMEILYSARTSNEYVALEGELDALRVLRNDRSVADAATSAMRELAARSDGYVVSTCRCGGRLKQRPVGAHARSGLQIAQDGEDPSVVSV